MKPTKLVTISDVTNSPEVFERQVDHVQLPLVIQKKEGAINDSEQTSLSISRRFFMGFFYLRSSERRDGTR
ncbi:hypothetical protein GUT189_18200 [Streptococcus ruminantium]|nr:hypothetical protein GUT189_18200 [Streptococcus ruminantium]